MSAAAPPTPPPHRTPFLPSNGAGTSGTRRPFAHVRDLALDAQRHADQYAPVHSSLKRLLEQADQALRQAQRDIDFRRPDLAYKAYLEATYIVADVLPRNKDAFELTGGKWRSAHRDLIARIGGQKATFDQIEASIEDDNRRSGVQPISITQIPASTQQPSSDSFPPAPLQAPTSRHSVDHRPTSVHTRTPYDALDARGAHLEKRHSTPYASSDAPSPPRNRPPTMPKPQNLHSMTLSGVERTSSTRSNGIEGDALSERFKKLRMPSSVVANGNGTTYQDYETSRPPNDHERQPVRTSSTTTYRYPDKIRTNHLASKNLPRAPSPTYSPARTSHTDLGSRTVEQQYGDLTNSVDSGSTSSARLSNGYDRSSAIYSGQSEILIPSSRSSIDSARPVNRRRRNTINKPQETEIDADRLFDYLKTFDVLLIDVRSREQYDEGHIYSESGMCIEPTVLRPNTSAEDLAEALVLSPDNERALFERRNEFDLVVYYDRSTVASVASYPSQVVNPALRYLYDTLSEFNQEKPLKFPPVQLKGGLDSWIEIFSAHSLKTSDTAIKIKQAQKTGRPIARRPLVSRVSTRTKKREYNPLNAEEEQKWRARAASETVVVPQDLPTEHDTADNITEEGHDRTEDEYDTDFERRYPDVDDIDSSLDNSHFRPMLEPPPRPAPARIPSYPTPPAPTVPARPPPAVPRPSYSGVSERIASTTSIPRIKQPPPYIPPRHKLLPRTGLHNFGVTCYMNATIQCLSATIPLTTFFLGGQWMKDLQRDNNFGSKGLMAELYNVLLRNLWQTNDVDIIRPTNFRKFCARRSSDWGREVQQDAKEFFDFLLDDLHDDLNYRCHNTRLRALTPAEERQREAMPAFVAASIEWARVLHRDHSKIYDLFYGQHLSRVTCMHCHTTSTTYEAFSSISVEIPRPSRSRASVSLHDCLASYCATEELRGPERWHCTTCNTLRDSWKKITLIRAPQILTVHFKRFSAGPGQTARKVATVVDFPLSDLDLGPYMLPPPEHDPVYQADPARYDKFPHIVRRDRDSAVTPPYRYDAYAVMRHLGSSLSSGHYIAMVADRARRTWRCFNDDSVSDFEPGRDRERLRTEEAYIVFYERQELKDE